MSEWAQLTVQALQDSGVLRVEDGNHGEYRPRRDEFSSVGTAFIRAADMADGEVLFNSASKITEPALLRIRKGIGRPWDVLLSHKGTVGKVARVGASCPPFVCSPQTTFYRSLQHEVIDPEFLFYYLQSPRFQQQLFSRKGETDMADYVSLSEQRRLIIDIRPLAEQRGIAEVLGALDDKIACNDRIRRRCDELLQAMFQRTAAPALSHLVGGGVLPPGWLADSLGEWLRVLETGSRPKGGVGRYTSGVPSLGAESVIGLARFDYSKTKYVPYDYFATMKRGVIEDQDVLLYKDGGRPGEFEPHVAMLGGGFPFGRFCINEHAYRLRTRAPLTQEYLFCWLSNTLLLEEMRRRGTGVAVPGLNSSAVKALPIVVPPPDVLVGFAGIATSLIRQALAVARESRSLSVFRDFLLPRLLSGELTVRSAEGLVDAV